MTKEKDGGPAFPIQGSGHDRDNQFRLSILNTGMSLRDWFAGMVICNADWNKVDAEEGARMAYVISDAMLKERER